MKKRVKKPKKIGKGMPSAVILSILIHVGLFLLAGMLVVFTVVKKEEQKFEPPKAVDRPKMKLKKPKVKVKKTSKPKPTTRIVTKMNRASMPDIQLPEMTSMGEGLTGGLGGFDLMPDVGETTLFGSGQSIGNDFVGTFYDLKRDRAGRDIPMDTDMYLRALRKFVVGDWKVAKLAKYYHSPKELYATSFMIPTILSSVAPAAFDEADTLGYCWMAHYKGDLVHKDGIKFRFWGQGDDILLVKVNGKLVLNACWPGDSESQFSSLWQTSSAKSRTYYLGNNKSVVGDWITLEPGVPLDMEVMIGEKPGGGYCAMLLVEVEGVKYERGPQSNPLLPMFKTTEPSLDLIDAIYRDLVVGEATVTNGPVFSDYETGGQTVSLETAEPEPTAVPDNDPVAEEVRTWTREDGKVLEAKLLAVVSGNAVLEDSRKKQRKIPLDQFSEKDRIYIELTQPPEFKIDFSKKSSQFIGKMSPYNSRAPAKVLDYVFSTRLKQISTGPYNHELFVEFFAVGSEIFGDHYVLLDRQESRFTPAKEDQQTYEFSGESVRLTSYELYGDFKGIKYDGYLVVVTDSRGKIVAHRTPNKWLFENLENLRRLPVGRYMDKTCTRTFPSRPITDKY